MLDPQDSAKSSADDAEAAAKCAEQKAAGSPAAQNARTAANKAAAARAAADTAAADRDRAKTAAAAAKADDRMAIIENVKHAGISTCSGGIIGRGESDEDIIDLALALRAMDINSLPINFLHSTPKTPFESKKQLTPQKCLKTLCLFRFVNPSKEIRVAGVREVNLRSLQPLSLYPANSLFVNSYLITPGQEASDPHQMIADLGFELDQPAAI